MARESKAMEFCDAMKTALEAKDWNVVTPKAVIIGVVSPGWLAFPVVSIMPTDLLAAREFSGRSVYEETQTIVWELAEVLDPANFADQYIRHIEWRAEVLDVMRAAGGGVQRNWGIGACTMSVFRDAEINLASVETSDSSVAHILTSTIAMEVTYREQIA